MTLEVAGDFFFLGLENEIVGLDTVARMIKDTGIVFSGIVFLEPTRTANAR